MLQTLKDKRIVWQIFAHKYKNVDEMSKLQFAQTDSKKLKYLGSSTVINYFKSVL